MKVLVVAGGKPETWPALTEMYDFICGVDRGNLFLLEKGWSIDLAVGDFDSMSDAEFAQVQESVLNIERSNPEKDYTDTELALKEVFERFPEAQVLLIGATGGRLDHLLANLWLGVNPLFSAHVQQIKIADQQNHLQYLLPGHHVIKKQADKKYLAYCCLTPVQALTLTKSKYTLDGVDVLQPYSYASNEFLGEEAEVRFTSGVIAVIQSHD